MSKEELLTILKIIDLNQQKTEHIYYQRYSEAANARDNERVYEWKLLNILGYQMSDERVDREKLLNEYFLKKFSIDYPKNMTIEFKKNLIRQIKLEELGI